MTPEERLQLIADQIADGSPSPSTSVREFLSWFGAYRRGYWIVSGIREALGKAHLETDPDFESAYIDSPILFVPRKEPAEEPAPVVGEVVGELEDVTLAATGIVTPRTQYGDPMSRISKLAAANRPVVSVTPDSTLEEAITLMLGHDFSQLPVMTSDRDVKGVISWYSIGSRLALGHPSPTVRDLMDEAHEIRADASLFTAIPTIVQNQYVLVRGADNRITGIVTSSDMSLQFQQLSEPFLLLGEIENHVRRLISDHFTADELAAARDPSDADRAIGGVADLTFGEYIRLLENQDRWAKLGLAIDRKTFISQLDRVRGIRNDVVHFDPDPLPEDDLDALRRFAVFLRRLQTLGVT